MAVIQKKASDLPKSSTIPAATYRFRVNKCDLFTVADAKEKKADSKLEDDVLNLDLVVMDEGPTLGRHVFDNVPLSGDFAWRCRQFLTAIEYPEDEDIDTDKIIDAEFTGVVSIVKEQVGKDGNVYPEKNRVSKFLKVQG